MYPRATADAFDREVTNFVEFHFKSITAALTLYCGDSDQAQEAAQEAFARAWAGWRKVRQLDRPEAWVYRVGVNYCNSVLRRRRTVRRRGLQVASSPLDPDRQTEVLNRLEMRQMLKDVGVRQRTALIGRYFLDLSYKELADALGVPESTAKSLVRRGVNRLRQSMDLREES